MTNKIKDEELENLQKHSQEQAKILHDLGVLEAQKHELLHGLASLIEKNEGFKKELEANYGKVNVSLQDGTYEPIPEKQDGEGAANSMEALDEYIK